MLLVLIHGLLALRPPQTIKLSGQLAASRWRTSSITMQADAGGDGDEEGERPWWQRPPRVWPPVIEDPNLVCGDVIAAYATGYATLNVLTTGREGAWESEGAAMASAWIVAAAVTNAWDPTATLPSLGLGNVLGCVARASVDLASTRVVFALAGAVLARQAVDVKLLITELVCEVAALMLWRSIYHLQSQDPR